MKISNHFDMLPERAFTKKLFGYSPATLEGKSSSSAPAADPGIAKSQQQMADLATQEYNDFKTNIWPQLQQQTQSQVDMSNKVQQQQYDTTQTQNDIAAQQYARYQEKGIPIQDQLYDQASTAGSDQEQEAKASQAIGDVRSQMDAAQASNEANMKSYGVDPTSGAFQGQANANQIMGAATGAAAATRARDAAIQLGWAKKMDAAGMAQGTFGNQASSTALGLNAGSTSLASGAMGTNAINAMGNSYTQGTNAAMSGWNNVGNLALGATNAANSAWASQNAANAQSSSGFGQAIGGLAGAGINAYAKMNSPAAILTGSDIRLKENIEFIGYLPSGLRIYEYEYKPEFKNHPLAGHGRFRGVMAHEVETVIPGAVFEMDNGYKAVDYSKVN